MDKPDLWGKEAVVRFEANDFNLLKEGRFVRCAVTGEPISLEDLRYWNVQLQEAYRGPAEALARWRQLNPKDTA